MQRINPERLLYWVRPVGTILLGLALLLHPISVTKTMALVIGFAIALIGAGLLVTWMTEKDNFLRLCAGIILLVVGFSIIRSPLMLPTRLGKLVGILLVVNCIRELSSGIPIRGRKISAALGIAGAALIMVPLSASWLISVVLGIAVLGSGAGMLAARLYDRKHPVKPDIIDSL